MNIIDVRNVSKQYTSGNNTFYALRNVTFKAEKGEFISIMGTSGSGKTTLMNILGCLDPIEDGEYYFNGQNMKESSDNEMAEVRSKGIGFVFQSFNLLEKMTIQENVALPLVYTNYGLTERMDLASIALRSVGLGDRMHHLPGDISGGQRQRVAIARALVNKPSLILADEPTGNLDTSTEKEIMSLLRDMREQYQPTIIIVTHDEHVALYADRIITLFDGRKCADMNINQLEADMHSKPDISNHETS